MSNKPDMAALTREVISRVMPRAECTSHYSHWIEAIHPEFPIALNFSTRYGNGGRVAVTACLPMTLRQQINGCISDTFLHRPGAYPNQFERNITPERFTTQPDRVAAEIDRIVLAPALPAAIAMVKEIALRQETVNAVEDCARALAKHMKTDCRTDGDYRSIYSYRGEQSISVQFYSLGGGKLNFTGTTEALDKAARVLHEAFSA